MSAPAHKNNPISTTSTITSRPTSLKQESQESIDKFSNIDLTANAHHALQNRDTFLQSNELVLIKEFLRNIGFEKDFDNHVFKDPQFLQAATNLSYKWKTFVELKKEYTFGAAYSKASKLRDDLERIQTQTSLILEIVNRITDIKIDDTMNSFALSRSYLKKADIISEFLTACATLTSLITDRSLIYALNRRISQQKK